MGESAIAQVAAEVMLFHEGTKSWVSPAGLPEGRASCVQILQHNQQQNFRIIATRQEDGAMLMNCRIHSRFKYHPARSTFHQWRDENRQVYGLNFASEQDAQTFHQRMEWTVELLKSIQQQIVNGEYHVPDAVYQDPNQPPPIHHNTSAPSFLQNGAPSTGVGHPYIEHDMSYRKTSQPQPQLIHHHQQQQHQMMLAQQQQQQQPQSLAAINRRASQGSSIGSQNGGPSAILGNHYAQQPSVASPSRAPAPAPPVPVQAPPAPPAAAPPPAPPPPPPTTAAAPPPPPPPPPPPAGPSGGLTLADQIKAGIALRKTSTKEPAASGSSSVSNPQKETRSQSLSDEKAPAAGNGGGNMMAELMQTLNKRKNTKAQSDSQDNKSNISNGSADSGTSSSSDIRPPPPPPVAVTTTNGPTKKWEPIKTNGITNGTTSTAAVDSPKAHRKAPSASSISSQDGLVNGNSHLTSEFLERFRADLMLEVKEEISRAKQEIIEAIRQELQRR